jgi:SET domain-containing protein
MANTKPIVKRSRSGLGLFAQKDYQKGDYIIEYTGERISEQEANRRGGKYLFRLNKKLTIDGKGRENLARYINHSCRPNAYPELNYAETRIRIYAKKKITSGEEITYNYGKMYFKDLIEPHGCKCEKCLTD